LGAKTVKALPFPCFFSKRARDFWPAGWLRRKRTAASEKAHVREALPLFVPEVLYRFPADSLAHVTKRQEDTKSWTRGKRAMSGKLYWLLGWWTCVNSSARFRMRGIRRLSRSRVARMSAG